MFNVKSPFFKNIFYTFSSRFLSAIFTSFSTILIARAFGPIGKGIFTMVAFFPLLALQFGHLGLGNANTYLIAQDKEKTKKSFYNSFWCGLVIGWFFIVSFALIYRYFPISILGKGNIGNWAFYLSLLSIPFILWENFYQGIFVGRQEFKFFNIVGLISKILLLVGLLWLIYFWKVNILNIKIAVFYYIIVISLPAIIYTFYFLLIYGFPFEFDITLFRKAINFGLRSYLACLFAFLILRSDIYILNYFRGLKEVGWYSVAVGFCDGILLITSSIALALFPKITENQEEGLEITLKVSRLSSLILFIILITSFLFGKYVILILFGKEFINSLIPLYILLPAVYFLSISTLLSHFFASRGFPLSYLIILPPPFGINIILNFIFIPRFGILAAAMTSLVAYFLNFLLHWRFLNIYTKQFIKLRVILVPFKGDFSMFSRVLGKYSRKYE